MVRLLKGAIIKVTLGCNLNCVYCGTESAVTKRNPKTIEEKFVRNFLDEIFSLDEKLRYFQIIWHGGEPLLTTHQFFDKICTDMEDLSSSYGVKTIHHIQTNATLVSDDYCKVLKKHGFKLGISCDGPAEINDLFRVYPNGRGSYDSIQKSANLLRNNGLDFGMLAVITKESIKYSDKIYRTSKKIGAKGLKVNPLKPYGRGMDVKAPSPSEYSNFLRKLFNIWINDAEVHGCVPLQSMVEGLLTGNTNLCTFDKEGCSEWLSLTPDGGVYPCEEYINNPEFRLGSVNENAKQWFCSSGWKTLHNCMRKKSESCSAKCNYRQICNGGCTKSFLIFGERNYCLSSAYDYISDYLCNAGRISSCAKT